MQTSSDATIIKAAMPHCLMKTFPCGNCYGVCTRTRQTIGRLPPDHGGGFYDELQGPNGLNVTQRISTRQPRPNRRSEGVIPALLVARRPMTHKGMVKTKKYVIENPAATVFSTPKSCRANTVKN